MSPPTNRTAPYVCAPVQYRRWRGKTRPDSLNSTDGWENPRVREDDDGTWWLEQLYDSPGWFPAGYAPRGRTRWQRFWRHWHHGRLMRYPRLSVFVWCVQTWNEPMMDDES